MKTISSQSDLNIKVINVSKRFLLHRGPRVLLSMLFSKKKSRLNIFQALTDISFQAKKGEVVGLIGRNGSGKSTLLRTIAGLLKEDLGSIEVRGVVLYLSGLSFCSDPYMTVRENIYFIGTILGMHRFEITAKMAEIIDFAGLIDFIDVETFKLSSGMQVRLNVSATFFCMEHIHPDILLLDEVLSTGGDIEFQIKSMVKIESLVKSGATIIIASHDLPFMEKFCHQVVWLDRGRVRQQGNPVRIIQEYKENYL